MLFYDRFYFLISAYSVVVLDYNTQTASIEAIIQNVHFFVAFFLSLFVIVAFFCWKITLAGYFMGGRENINSAISQSNKSLEKITLKNVLLHKAH